MYLMVLFDRLIKFVQIYFLLTIFKSIQIFIFELTIKEFLPLTLLV